MIDTCRDNKWPMNSFINQNILKTSICTIYVLIFCRMNPILLERNSDQHSLNRKLVVILFDIEILYEGIWLEPMRNPTHSTCWTVEYVVLIGGGCGHLVCILMHHTSLDIWPRDKWVTIVISITLIFAMGGAFKKKMRPGPSELRTISKSRAWAFTSLNFLLSTSIVQQQPNF